MIRINIKGIIYFAVDKVDWSWDELKRNSKRWLKWIAMENNFFFCLPGNCCSRDQDYLGGAAGEPRLATYRHRTSVYRVYNRKNYWRPVRAYGHQSSLASFNADDWKAFSVGQIIFTNIYIQKIIRTYLYD